MRPGIARPAVGPSGGIAGRRRGTLHHHRLAPPGICRRRGLRQCRRRPRTGARGHARRRRQPPGRRRVAGVAGGGRGQRDFRQGLRRGRRGRLRGRGARRPRHRQSELRADVPADRLHRPDRGGGGARHPVASRRGRDRQCHRLRRQHGGRAQPMAAHRLRRDVLPSRPRRRQRHSRRPPGGRRRPRRSPCPRRRGRSHPRLPAGSHRARGDALRRCRAGDHGRLLQGGAGLQFRPDALPGGAGTGDRGADRSRLDRRRLRCA